MSKPTAADRLEELANWDGGDLVNYVTWGNDELLRNAAELVRACEAAFENPDTFAGNHRLRHRIAGELAKLQGSNKE